MSLYRQYTGKISKCREEMQGGYKRRVPKGNMQRIHAQKFTRIQRDFIEKKKGKI